MNNSLLRKIVCTGLAALMCVTALGGCGEKEGSGGKKNGANGKETSLTLDEVMSSIPSELKGTTINYFVWDTPAVEADVIKNFEEKSGIKVNIIKGSYAEYVTELNLKVSTGQSPDVVRLLNNGISRIKSLQPLENSGFNFNDTAWDKTTMKDYTYSGKAYATNLINTAFYDGLVVFYDKQLFEDNDLDDPYQLYKDGEWTWSKFEKMSEEFKKLGSDYWGASFCPFELYSMAHGVSFAKYDGEKYTNTITDPLLASTWKKTLEWTKSGLVSPDTWRMDEFMAGKVGFFFASISGARTKDTGYRKFKAKKTLGVVPLPVDDDENVENYQPLIEYSAWGIPQGAKNAEAVPYFLRYVLDKDNYENLFINKESEEIYKDMIANKNRCPDSAGDTITEDSGNSAGGIIYEIKQADPQQIATVLQTYNGIVNDSVTKANDQISKLTK